MDGELRLRHVPRCAAPVPLDRYADHHIDDDGVEHNDDTTDHDDHDDHDDHHHNDHDDDDDHDHDDHDDHDGADHDDNHGADDNDDGAVDVSSVRDRRHASGSIHVGRRLFVREPHLVER